MFSCLRKSKAHSNRNLGGTNNAALSLDGVVWYISYDQYLAKADTLKQMLATKYNVKPEAVTITVNSSPTASSLKLTVTIDGVDPAIFTADSLKETLYSWKQLLNVTLCSGINCGANGTCSGGKCICQNGYTGTRCQTPPADPCANINCGTNGTCSDGKCICKDGYTGTTCETPPPPPPKDLCADVNCGPNGTCCGGKCFCNTGYTGANCEKTQVWTMVPTAVGYSDGNGTKTVTVPAGTYCNNPSCGKGCRLDTDYPNGPDTFRLTVNGDKLIAQRIDSTSPTWGVNLVVPCYQLQ